MGLLPAPGERKREGTQPIGQVPRSLCGDSHHPGGHASLSVQRSFADAQDDPCGGSMEALICGNKKVGKAQSEIDEIVQGP